MRAIKTSRLALRPHREKRQSLIEAYAGSEWGNANSGKRETLVNLLSLTADTYSMALAANRPRVMVTTHKRALQPFANRFRIAINNLITEIHLEETLRKLVLDACFSVGIAKVYRAPAGRVQIFNPDFPPEPGPFASQEEWDAYQDAQQTVPVNVWIDPGKPFVEAVSLDDFVFDTQVNSWEKIRFAADEFRVPFASLEDDDRYDPEVVKLLKPSSKWATSEWGDAEDAARNLTQNNHDHDELEPMISLMNVWLPGEGKWCVMASDGATPPLFMEDWTGPEEGPYHLLGFSDVPDNIMPMSPLQNLKGLHNLLNLLMRKSAWQARNQKTITMFSGSAKDAQQVVSAKDGDAVRVNNPDTIREVSYNGVNQMTTLFYQMVDGVFSRMAGNLDAMAGLGPQSETATQDQLIHAAVSKREAKMQFRVVDFTAKICRDLGKMLWEDQLKSIPGQYTVEGVSELPVPMDWNPGEREGDFLDYEFNVEPYSMVYQSPSQRMQALLGFIERVHIPLAPIMEAQGGTLDLQELTKIGAEYLDMPDLARIVTFTAPMQPSGEEAGGMPQQTTRNYVRRSVGSSNPQGERTAMMQQMMSAGGSQPGTNLG